MLKRWGFSVEVLGEKTNFPKFAEITFVNKQNGPFLSTKYWGFNIQLRCHQNQQKSPLKVETQRSQFWTDLLLKNQEKYYKNRKIFGGKMQSSWGFKLDVGRRNNQAMRNAVEVWKHFKGRNTGITAVFQSQSLGGGEVPCLPHRIRSEAHLFPEAWTNESLIADQCSADLRSDAAYFVLNLCL